MIESSTSWATFQPLSVVVHFQVKRVSIYNNGLYPDVAEEFILGCSSIFISRALQQICQAIWIACMVNSSATS
jgi:hypothetical protein